MSPVLLHRRTGTAGLRGFGWKRDPRDSRDWSYEPTIPPKDLPTTKDLRPFCPPVYDQKGLNSCSANALAAAVEFDLMKEKQKRVIFPSRLFLFYNARAQEHTEKSNEGVYIRDAIKSVAKHGDCPERLWPYVEHKFATRPPKSCYDEALTYRLVKYYRIHRGLDNLRSCIASGYPFIFGFLAHAKFLDVVRKTGVLEMPARGERVLGKHAVLAVGYEDKDKCFIVRNSWGPRFGLRGYFTMPYEYVLRPRFTDDFWTIRVVA